MKRADSSKWVEAELAILATMYALSSWKEIAEAIKKATGATRSITSISSKASKMGLKKAVGFCHGRSAPLRDRIIALLNERKEITVGQLRYATGAHQGSCAKIMQALVRQGNAHIHHWITKGPAHTAVYRIGAGVSAPYPGRRPETNTNPSTHEFPRPVLGPWGLCWTSTQEEQRRAA